MINISPETIKKVTGFKRENLKFLIKADLCFGFALALVSKFYPNATLLFLTISILALFAPWPAFLKEREFSLEKDSRERSFSTSLTSITIGLLIISAIFFPTKALLSLI